jgi:hypothetical protein
MASAAMAETYSELQARYEDLLRSEVRELRRQQQEQEELKCCVYV